MRKGIDREKKVENRQKNKKGNGSFSGKGRLLEMEEER